MMLESREAIKLEGLEAGKLEIAVAIF